MYAPNMAATLFHTRSSIYFFFVFYLLVHSSFDLSHHDTAFHQPRTVKSFRSGISARCKTKFKLPPLYTWTKHGYICYSIPDNQDITVHMDVELNPGPDSSTQHYKRRTYRGRRGGR